MGENVADVNSDGRVDIIDLCIESHGAFGDAAAAPAVYADTQEMLSASNVQHWLIEAHKVNLTDSTFQRRSMLMLEQLLIVLTPKDTASFTQLSESIQSRNMDTLSIGETSSGYCVLSILARAL